jgi:hypothetical protein
MTEIEIHNHLKTANTLEELERIVNYLKGLACNVYCFGIIEENRQLAEDRIKYYKSKL